MRLGVVFYCCQRQKIKAQKPEVPIRSLPFFMRRNLLRKWGEVTYTFTPSLLLAIEILNPPHPLCISHPCEEGEIVSESDLL